MKPEILIVSRGTGKSMLSLIDYADQQPEPLRTKLLKDMGIVEFERGENQNERTKKSKEV